jgi:hypothetical protein
MKQITLLLNKLFKRRQPIYGERIFQQRSWLSKQVEEAMWNRSRGIR